MTPDNTLTAQIDDEAMSRTWRLVAELCSQLASNRERIQSLEQQLLELQTRANEFTGPLIRASIRAPPFEAGSEIERQNLRLIYESQQLNEENAALSSLVKEYESTLQIVMGKFRVQAHEIQQSKLQMQREYEALLEEEQAKTVAAQKGNAALQSHLSIIGNLVRQAYDIQTDLDTEILVESLCVENQGLREILGISDANNPLFQDDNTSKESTATTPLESLIKSEEASAIRKRDRILAEAEKEEDELRKEGEPENLEESPQTDEEHEVMEDLNVEIDYEK